MIRAIAATNPERATQDASRTGVLAGHGSTVVRFWDNEVLQNLVGVLEASAREVTRRTLAPSPSPLPR